MGSEASTALNAPREEKTRHRLDLTREDDASKVERDLRALLPEERWGHAHQLFVWHGRRTWVARAGLLALSGRGPLPEARVPRELRR